MDNTQKKQSFQWINTILRILAIVYFYIALTRSRDPYCLLTAIPIIIIAVSKRTDKTNLLLSIMVLAGLVLEFIARYILPKSFHTDGNYVTLFGQIHIVIWVLSIYIGVFLLPFRDLVIASLEKREDGRIVRIIEYILLSLSIIPATFILGYILWMTVTNYYP